MNRILKTVNLPAINMINIRLEQNLPKTVFTSHIYLFTPKPPLMIHLVTFKPRMLKIFFHVIF